MARCRWVTDKDGFRFWLPQCYGGLYNSLGCYCPKPERVSRDEMSDLEQRMAALEAEVKQLKKAKGEQR